MNLTDLQVELRAMEEHLSVLQREIEEMKPKTEDEKRAQFAEITKLALKHPIKNPQVSAASEIFRNKYIQSLSYLLLSSESEISGKFLYLSRIAAGCGISLTAEEIYRAGLEIQTEDFDKICEDLQELKYSFLVDALVTANMSEENSDKDFMAIADIAGIFGCGKDELCVLSWIARAVLTCDWNVLEQIPVDPKSIRKISGNVRKMLPREWILSHRRECGRVCTETQSLDDSSMQSIFGEIFGDRFKPNPIKMRLQAGTIVKEADVLVRYEQKKLEPGSGFSFLYGQTDEVTEEKKIIAPCDGTVFFIADEEEAEGQKRTYLVVYVVSYFDDYGEFTEWYQSKKGLH